MSRDPRDDDDDDDGIPEALPPDRADGFAELDLRDTFGVLFTDPDVRNFAFAGLGALGMIFLILFQQGGDIGGLIVVVLGALGILLRWSASPVLILFVVTYFMVFPFGIPGETLGGQWEIEEGRFRVTDVMLVMSVLVYLACQYRIYGFVSQALPYEGAARRKDEKPARRPPALVRPSEIGVLLAVCAAFVVLGQLIWWAANSLEVVPTADFPLRWAEPDRARRGSLLPGGMNTGTARFVVLAGFAFFGTILARLVFGYWRLRAMGPAEGGMILLDGGWSETSRERQRQEAWRAWGRKRAAGEEKAGTNKAGGGS
jgi:hypothetical protein